MSLSVTAEFKLTAREILDESAAPGVTSRTLTHSAFNVTESLTGSSTTPVTKISEQELTGASGTIDLTSLPATGGGTQTALGLRLQCLRIHNRSTANDFSIAEGASNGYAIGGAAIVVKPGGTVQIFFNDKLGDVAAGDKTLDWTFASAQEADITLILG